jgi:hypothetical protein
MDKELHRYLGRAVEIIYVDRSGAFTKRIVQLHDVRDGNVKVFLPPTACAAYAQSRKHSGSAAGDATCCLILNVNCYEFFTIFIINLGQDQTSRGFAGYWAAEKVKFEQQ